MHTPISNTLWKRIGIGAALALVVSFYGCRTVAGLPDEALNNAEGIHAKTAIEAAHSLAADNQKSALDYHLHYLNRQPGPPIIAGNNTRLLIDGPAAYDAIFSALASAKNSIDIEMYIFDSDRIGNALGDILREKSRAGVRVRLMYDSVGCIQTPRDFFDRLRDDGVAIVEFHPVNPLAGKFLRLNNRDHRKIIIVDNAIAFTGGINVSSVYTHGSGVRRKTNNGDPERALEDGWRDTQIEITGPAVKAFSDLYDAMWMLAKGEPSLALPPLKKPGGHNYVRVVASSPEDNVNFIYSDLLGAIKRSRQSIHITMSYFSPNRAMIDALKEAAQRGVDVQLVLPGFSDWWPVLEAGRSHYKGLLDAGVQIYERKDVFLHAKTAVIDGVWSTVGSSNMDMRSFLHNYEINVVILGEEFGRSMETIFNKDMTRAEQVTPEGWRERSLSLRMKQGVARVFSYWL